MKMLVSVMLDDDGYYSMDGLLFIRRGLEVTWKC